MNDIDLHRISSPHMVPAAMEFLRLIGFSYTPQPAPSKSRTPSPEDRAEGQKSARSSGSPARQRAEQARQARSNGQTEVALDLLRQLSDEVKKHPPTLYEAVSHNPTAQGMIFRRGLFVADEIEVHGPVVQFEKATDAGRDFFVQKQLRRRRREESA
ncbi:MAG: hypothetical protein AB1758_22735 [Candidatus Eremiobacterota bacterium]